MVESRLKQVEDEWALGVHQFGEVGFLSQTVQRPVDVVGIAETAGIRISMDGRGRYLDNIFVERLWRTVIKYEDIYIKEYAHVPALFTDPGGYFHVYNYERPHQSLGYYTPADVHFSIKAPNL